ncbi:hypothetical protein [Actinocrinis sp.]|uniref:hypothetical protein n=1 Tax=Actinocrinis sp. TaxID=1920516 RepID=UPI002D4D3F54|nr:hypothetical protein [Actinocrinis sp.]HZP55042.1 hypothetical protein [Actinocrinis sp.]
MPPRTRKTAAPAPSLEDAAAGVSETVEESAPPSPAQSDATAPEDTPTPDTAVAAGAAQETTTEGEAAQVPSEPAPAAEVQPATPTFHWESVKNDGTEPCRLCPPGTPPDGAGSYGCPHGQWVRVQDSD